MHTRHVGILYYGFTIRHLILHTETHARSAPVAKDGVTARNLAQKGKAKHHGRCGQKLRDHVPHTLAHMEGQRGQARCAPPTNTRDKRDIITFEVAK